MPQISVSGLRKTYSGRNGERATAIDHVDLRIEEGEFVVLLGPSGCGKTTTLRSIAGLEEPDEGQIRFGQSPMFDSAERVNVPPDKRSIGMVFQSYALWPHMTVRRNIEYPLRVRKMREALKGGWALEAAERVECEALLDRYPSQLSGGQQQRVALARGLVSRPQLVLFDEPLSNLDARLRDQVRAEIHELHETQRFSALYVTHDQNEALALGDRMAIMRAGRIEQIGAPTEVFARPSTAYVAGFIGYVNELPIDVDERGWTIGPRALRMFPAARTLPSGKHVARIHPEDIRLAVGTDDVGADFEALPGRVIDNGFVGKHIDVVVEVYGSRLQVRLPTAEAGNLRLLSSGEEVTVGIPVNGVHLYSVGGGGR